MTTGSDGTKPHGNNPPPVVAPKPTPQPAPTPQPQVAKEQGAQAAKERQAGAEASKTKNEMDAAFKAQKDSVGAGIQAKAKLDAFKAAAKGQTTPSVTSAQAQFNAAAKTVGTTTAELQSKAAAAQAAQAKLNQTKGGYKR